jgi:glyoxylase-like metal-dependent hydrolase (beta-lactamase superfamily II)
MWISKGRRESRAEKSGTVVARAAAFVRLLPSPFCGPLIFAFCLLLSAGFLIPTASSRSPARGLYEVREIKPGVFVWIPEDVLDLEGDPLFNRPGTAGFIVAADGVVVVNTTNSPFHARELLYEIRQRTDLPVRYVINTGAEPDQMLGNEAFVDQGATIISSLQAQAVMRRYRDDLERRLKEDENWRLQGRMRGIHPTLPSQVFGEDMSLCLGDEEVRIRRVVDGGSGGDAVVYLPAQKVLFLGRLFANGYFPRIDSINVRRWIKVLRDLETWDVALYVPGHGPPGDKKQLAEFRSYLEWLVKEIEPRLQQRKTLGEVRREVNPLENYHWGARDVGMRAVEEVYQQLAAELPAPGEEPLPAAPADHP